MELTRAWPAVALCLALSACKTGRPLVDTSPENADAQGTITGTVRAGEDGVPVVGRRVEAVEARTGRRHAATTNASGGYTLLVPSGTYSIEVALEEGERVVERPDSIDLGKGDVDSDKDVVLGPAEPRAELSPP